jgi:polyphenol oxidase
VTQSFKSADELRYLISPALTGFVHGFTLAPHDFALPSAKRNDAEASLATALGMECFVVQQATQVHGARIVSARQIDGGNIDDTKRELAFVEREEADGLIATASMQYVGVRTADCVPILVGCINTGAVAAIHAGWRGLVDGVIEAGLTALRAHGATILAAAIGPCIGPDWFEVGEDVATTIANATDPNVVVRHPGRAKPHIDLRAAVRLALARAEVATIDDVGGSTYADRAYHSYRRDGATSGRMLAFIRAGF